MKNAYLLILISLLPFCSFAQSDSNKQINSGFSLGINTEIILIGEFGVFGEYYFNKNSVYVNVNYNRAALGGDNKVNVDMAEYTKSYYCASGPTLRAGYRRIIHESEKSRGIFFMGAEFIYKEFAYNHLTLERPSDKRYLYNEVSMYSTRLGGALRLGYRKTFFEESKAYWAISIAAGGLYRTETTTLHSSATYTEIILNQPYTIYGFINTVSLNLILGFDFR